MAKTSAAKPAAKNAAAAKTPARTRAGTAVKAQPKAVPKAAVKGAARPAARKVVKPAARKSATALAGPAAKKPPATAAIRKAVVKRSPQASLRPASAASKAGMRNAATPLVAGKAARGSAKRQAKVAVVAPLALPPAAARPKLVRDSFTMPEPEYAVLAEVKQACLKAGFEIKKSELLRIGVALVGQVDLATLQSVLASLPQLKTGRPRSE
jgi:hypothetical protein